MIKNISASSDELQIQGEGLKQSSHDLLLGNEELVKGITIVKQASEESAASSVSSIEFFQTIKKEIVSIVDQMQTIFTSSEEMNGLASIGNVKTKEMLKTLSVYRSELKKMNETVVDIQQYSHAITSVVRIIQEIAEKTKLLAFNATIEATKRQVRLDVDLLLWQAKFEN